MLSPLSLLVFGISATASIFYGFFWTRRGPSNLKSAIKFIPVGCLALIAVIEGSSWYLVTGLALGAVGDIFLSLDEESGFLPGLAAFLLGHIAFVLLFFEAGLGIEQLTTAAWRIAGAIALAIVAMLMFWKLRPHLGSLLPAVMAYIAVIFCMGLSAMTLPLDPYSLAIIGALMFIASDAVLSCELFLMSKENPARRVTSVVLWFLYWGGQALIMLAFVGPRF